MTDDRADTIRRLVLARCPELTAADLALLAEPPDVAIWDAVVDVVDTLERRLEALEGGPAAPRVTH